MYQEYQATCNENRNEMPYSNLKLRKDLTDRTIFLDISGNKLIAARKYPSLFSLSPCVFFLSFRGS